MAPVHYIDLQKKTALKEKIFDLRNTDSNPKGKYLEVRGTVKGIRNQNQVWIETEDKTYIWINMPKDTDMNNLDIDDDQICLLLEYDNSNMMSLENFNVFAWAYKVPVEAKEKELIAEQSNKNKDKNYAPIQYKFTPQMPQIPKNKDISAKLATVIKSANKNLTTAQIKTYSDTILYYSAKYEICPIFVCSVITEESKFKHTAVSKAGASGLGQLMPATASGMGISNVFDPQQNIYGTVRYLRSMLDRLCGKDFTEASWEDLALILSGYNAGPGNVKKYGGIPPFKETKNYIVKVTNTYKKYLNNIRLL